jgi:hypothetical protein
MSTIRLLARNVTPDSLAAFLVAVRGATFAALTYAPKTGYIVPPVVRYSVTLGADYGAIVRGNLAGLEAIDGATLSALELAVRDKLVSSARESLQAHAEGRAHAANTRAGTYVTVANGVRYLTDSDTWEVLGMVRHRRVIAEGERKVVKSKPETLARQAAERRVKTLSGFRFPQSFTLSRDAVESMSYRGNVLSFR